MFYMFYLFYMYHMYIMLYAYMLVCLNCITCVVCIYTFIYFICIICIICSTCIISIVYFYILYGYMYYMYYMYIYTYTRFSTYILGVYVYIYVFVCIYIYIHGYIHYIYTVDDKTSERIGNTSNIAGLCTFRNLGESDSMSFCTSIFVLLRGVILLLMEEILHQFLYSSHVPISINFYCHSSHHKAA